jgi:hypothetical protein
MDLFNQNRLGQEVKPSRYNYTEIVCSRLGYVMEDLEPKDYFIKAWGCSDLLDQDLLLRQHVSERFVSKYLPVIISSKNRQQEMQAWYGFYSWLTYPPTSRKPFEIPKIEADEIIATLKDILIKISQSIRKEESKFGEVS